MSSDVVTTVDEPCLTGGNTLSKGDSLVECLMAVVGFLTKGIDHKSITAFDKWYFFLTDGFHVGNVYQRALWCLPIGNAVAEDGKVVVHDLEGNNVKIAHTEMLMLMDFVKLDGGNPWIAVFRKTVWQHLQHTLTGNGVGIDVDFAKLTIGTDIVHASHVVVMCMGNEDGVNFAERMRHDLLAEVRTTVYEQAGLIALDEY